MLIVPADALQYVQLPGRRSADPLRDLDAPVSVRLVRIEPGPGRRPHRHPHSLELVHVLAGRGTAWQGGERHPVGPGDTIMIPQGVHHATLAAPGTALELVCFFPHPDLAANIEELDGPVLDA
ncbi:MAG TPA: cupin domain-containing protein [Egicoccus sp.]|nr:cupin domain-containing protein [Egicoccus sp.]HSK22943.1 cupin domain-containing protein [Egicoccus sp.]